MSRSGIQATCPLLAIVRVLFWSVRASAHDKYGGGSLVRGHLPARRRSPELGRAYRCAEAEAEAGEATLGAQERWLAPGSGQPRLGIGCYDCGEGLNAARFRGRSGPDGGANPTQRTDLGGRECSPLWKSRGLSAGMPKVIGLWAGRVSGAGWEKLGLEPGGWSPCTRAPWGWGRGKLRVRIRFINVKALDSMT